MAEAKEYESQDQGKRDAINTYNEAEKLLYRGERYLSEKKKELSREEKSSLKSAIQGLRKSMKKVKPQNITEEDSIRIKEAMDNLEQVL